MNALMKRAIINLLWAHKYVVISCCVVLSIGIMGIFYPMQILLTVMIAFAGAMGLVLVVLALNIVFDIIDYLKFKIEEEKRCIENPGLREQLVWDRKLLKKKLQIERLNMPFDKEQMDSFIYFNGKRPELIKKIQPKKIG